MLPKRNSNSIKTESGAFRYVVSEASQAGDDVALTINIQSESNGAMLRINGLVASRLPVMESKFYVGRSLKSSVLPRHILALIERGIDHGWTPDDSGPAVVLTVTNADIFDSAVP
jgi:hypothetical protein